MKRSTGILYLCAAILAQAVMPGPAIAKNGPKVVVSIKPIHSLVSGVMKGVGRPLLLIDGATSPHQFSLKPSQVRALHQAELIVWIGETLETALAKPIRSVEKKTMVWQLSGFKKLTVLDNTGHGHDHGHGQDLKDPHLWLDIGNAQVIAVEAARLLSSIDPKNGLTYNENATALVEKLAGLDRELKSRLATVADRPYLVYHNAFRYLEKRYDLNSQGSVVKSADHRPGARRIRQIRKRIVDSRAICLFSEPQFGSSKLATLSAGSKIRFAEIDPLGSSLKPGANTYSSLLRKLAGSFVTCLSK